MVMMGLSTAGEWIAWAGVIVSLVALAWSAVAYTSVKRREVEHQEYQRFFQITDHLGQAGGSIASKMTAAAYAAVIINICERANITGDAAEMLRDELKATADYMRQVAA